MSNFAHTWAIRELEHKIRDNHHTALRCEAYRDPQNEIDWYYEMNKDLQFTVDFLKSLPSAPSLSPAEVAAQTWKDAAKLLRYATAYGASPEKVIETFELNASILHDHKLEDDIELSVPTDSTGEIIIELKDNK